MFASSNHLRLGKLFVLAVISLPGFIATAQIPNITSQPRSTNVAVGLPATFSVTASAALAYQWYFNDAPLSDRTNASFTLPNVVSGDAGDYAVAVTNNSGSRTSSVATLVVGNVAVWGTVSQGQANVPLDLPVAASIAAGPNSGVATRPDGTVRSWDSPTINTNLPAGLTNILQVSAGSTRWLGLRTDGTVTAWASPATVPAGLSNIIAVAAGTTTSAALKSDGTVITWNNSSTSASVVGGMDNAVAISANNKSSGTTYTVVLRADGSVTAVGTVTALSSFLTSLTNVVAISAGADHCLALTAEGTVLAGGANASGQTNVPPGLSNVVGVAAGQGFSLALKEDGTAVGWGALPAASVPVALTNIVSLAAGNAHGMALLSDGRPVVTVHPFSKRAVEGDTIQLTALAVGSPAMNYQWLFNGTNLSNATNKTLSLADARTKDAGGYSLVISNALGVATSKVAQVSIRPQLSVAAWGFNGYGQTDVPTSLHNVSRLFSNYSHTVALLEDRTLVAWGDNRSGQCNVPASATNVVEVACGSSFTLARRGDGSLRIWGANSGFGGGSVLNIPLGISPSVGISAGYSLCASIQQGGFVTVWGSPASGGSIQSTLPGLNNVTAVALGDEHAVALRSDGTVVSWSAFPRYVPGVSNVPPGLSNVVAIAAGSYHTLTLRADGSVITWGNSNYGPPTVPADVTNVVAIAASANHSLALTAEGRLRIWGVGDLGGDSAGRLSVPTGLTNIVSIAAGRAHFLALVTNTPPLITQPPRSRSVPEGWPVTFKTTAAGEPPLNLQWQFNSANLLGATNTSLAISNVSLANVGEYRVIVSNAMGVITSSVAPLTIGSLLAAGENLYDQNWIPGDVTNGTSLAIGLNQGLVAGEDGSVKTWGVVPVDQPDIIGSLTDARAVAGGGASYSLVVRSNGQAIVWGNGIYPTLPPSLSNVVAAAVGIGFLVGNRADGTVDVSGGAYTPTNVPAGLSNVVCVAAGGGYAMALRDDGGVMSWGTPNTPTNVPVALSNVVAIAAGLGLFQPLALRGDGTVTSWDNNGTLLPIAGLSNAVAISAGLYHSLALRSDGTVYGWGNDQHGQIGFTSYLSNVVSVAAGWSSSLVKFGDGSPSIALHPFSRDVRGGQPFTLTSLAVGQPSLRYQWQRDGHDLPAATNTSLSITSASLADAGAYRFIATNALGAVTSAVATVTFVLDPPRFDTQGQPPQFGTGGFQMRINDLSGLGPVVIFASSNLVDWVPIFTNPATTDPVIFLDPAATNLPQRFYRANEER